MKILSIKNNKDLKNVVNFLETLKWSLKQKKNQKFVDFQNKNLKIMDISHLIIILELIDISSG